MRKKVAVVEKKMSANGRADYGSSAIRPFGIENYFSEKQAIVAVPVSRELLNISTAAIPKYLSGIDEE